MQDFGRWILSGQVWPSLERLSQRLDRRQESGPAVSRAAKSFTFSCRSFVIASSNPLRTAEQGEGTVRQLLGIKRWIVAAHTGVRASRNSRPVTRLGSTAANAREFAAKISDSEN
jgi:hypothetical protein